MNMPEAIKAPSVPSRNNAVRIASGTGAHPFTAIAMNGETIACTPPMNGVMKCAVQGSKAMMTATGDIVHSNPGRGAGGVPMM